ncbi:hypothetical protein A9Q84_12865 [Halobacteriovorax marinus]|uniref:Sigma-54 factor interaction domain-containing protein n=1 Tax=Halobacteriovorax marinus TaxID=97084 RepID=A0A1Y5FCM1_9BACT|nr:hypothetical protein A9Q84_12865 [Halobacteriovorax marinus]
MDNIVKLKSYRSFRIPVEPTDKISMVILKSDGQALDDKEIKWDITNVSLSGIAFESGIEITYGSILELELSYKSFVFQASSKVTRAHPIFNVFGEVESYQYGIEFFTGDQESGRDFISHFISSFSTKRLKKHLINLLINESRINTFTDGQKLSLSLSLFTDMKQFKGMESFLKTIFLECCRSCKSDVANVFILNDSRDSLYKLNLDDLSKEKICTLNDQAMINELLTTKRFKTVKSIGHLSLETFPTVSVNEKGEEFRHALFFPLEDSQGKTFGFFEFINFDADKSYTEADLSTIELFSNIFTMCYGNLDKSEFVNYLDDGIKYRNSSELIGKSKSIDVVQEFIQDQGDHGENVLIEGRHGVGKIHIAKNIHDNSATNKMAIGTIHCNEIESSSEFTLSIYGDSDHVGKLELYSGGTLILHEPSLLKKEDQETLLKALKDRTDIRVITTSTFSLEEICQEGSFNSELYEVLSKNYFFVPNLIDRKEDIPYLVNHFLDLLCLSYGLPSKRISSHVMDIFTNYNWPGNIQELRTTIERLVNYYPYVRFLDELPQKEFPIIGEYPRQAGIYDDIFSDNEEVINQTTLLEELIVNFCSANKLTREEFDRLYPSNEKEYSEVKKAS